MIKMKKVIVIISIVGVMLTSSGCSFISPSISKAQSEIRQEQLFEQQNIELKRIADALELMSTPNGVQ
jgi:hypothetical protein